MFPNNRSECPFDFMGITETKLKATSDPIFFNINIDRVLILLQVRPAKGKEKFDAKPLTKLNKIMYKSIKPASATGVIYIKNINFASFSCS